MDAKKWIWGVGAFVALSVIIAAGIDPNDPVLECINITEYKEGMVPTKTKRVFINETVCSDFPLNKTCEKQTYRFYDLNLEFEARVIPVQRTVCRMSNESEKR